MPGSSRLADWLRRRETQDTGLPLCGTPRGAADPDRAHHLQLCVAHVSAVGLKPSGAEVAEDVRDFQSGALHKRARLLPGILVGSYRREAIERALDAADYLGRNGDVDRGRLQLRMSEQNLDHADVHILVEQVSCKRMSKDGKRSSLPTFQPDLGGAIVRP